MVLLLLFPFFKEPLHILLYRLRHLPVFGDGQLDVEWVFGVVVLLVELIQVFQVLAFVVRLLDQSLGFRGERYLENVFSRGNHIVFRKEGNAQLSAVSRAAGFRVLAQDPPVERSVAAANQPLLPTVGCDHFLQQLKVLKRKRWREPQVVEHGSNLKILCFQHLIGLEQLSHFDEKNAWVVESNGLKAIQTRLKLSKPFLMEIGLDRNSKILQLRNPNRVQLKTLPNPTQNTGIQQLTQTLVDSLVRDRGRKIPLNAAKQLLGGQRPLAAENGDNLVLGRTALASEAGNDGG